MKALLEKLIEQTNRDKLVWQIDRSVIYVFDQPDFYTTIANQKIVISDIDCFFPEMWIDGICISNHSCLRRKLRKAAERQRQRIKQRNVGAKIKTIMESINE